MKSILFTFGICLFLISLNGSTYSIPAMNFPMMGAMQTGCPNVDNVLGTTKFIAETVAIMQEMNLRDFSGKEIKFLESGEIQCKNFCSSDPSEREQYVELGTLLSTPCREFKKKYTSMNPDSEKLQKDVLALYCNIVWQSTDPSLRTKVPQSNVETEEGFEDCPIVSMQDTQQSGGYGEAIELMNRFECVPMLGEAADRVLPGGSGRPLQHPELQNFLANATAAMPELAQNPALAQAVSMVTSSLNMSPEQEIQYLEFIHNTALTTMQFNLLAQNQNLMFQAQMCPNLTPANLKTIQEQNLATVNRLEAGKISLKASPQALADAGAVLSENPLSVNALDPNTQGPIIRDPGNFGDTNHRRFQ